MTKSFLSSAAVLLLTVVAVFTVNLGGAWYGGTASPAALGATVVYAGAVTVFLMTGRGSRVGVRVGFVWSLLSFLSAAWSLLMRLLHSGFVISAIISILTSVPFYGLRLWLDWTATYAVAAAVSLAWLVFSGLALRKAGKA